MGRRHCDYILYVDFNGNIWYRKIVMCAVRVKVSIEYALVRFILRKREGK